MTKPLSNQIKVQNLQKRIDAIGGSGTLTNVDFYKEFNEIILMGDGFLAIKGIISANGKWVKITKCPEHTRRMNGLPPQDISRPNRWPCIPDSCTSMPLSFQQFASICIKYKKAWTHFPNKT